MSTEPERFSTLLDMLAYRARINGDKTAFTFENKSTTYSELWDRVRRFGSFLLEQSLQPGKCVVVALPNGPDFFAAFYGIQLAGGIAVPLFPASDPARILRIAAACDAAYVVAPDGPRVGASRAAPGMPFVSVSQSAASPIAASFPPVEPDDLASLQYTSGSTGEPKSVILSHAHLLKNSQQMIAGMQITPHDVFVSWLPVYHDMGLILMTIVPFYLGAITHLLPTDLGDISLWLQTIESRRATFTAAPDFAYRLGLRRVEGNIDLSSLRVALNAAEPVRARTIRDFEARFHLDGVMTAGYGLAEATVGVSMSRPGECPRVDARGLVSVGHPFPEIEVRIVDGDRTLPPGKVGEIAIRTPAHCRGYYNSPVESERLFRPDGFLLSGDLGYLDDEGMLYIVGRKKNTIKLAGETIAPQEVEETVDAIPDVRFSSALGIDRGRLEGEQVIIFAELKGQPSHKQREEAALQIVEALHARLGFRPARVLLLKPHSIPRTHNGKIQHSALREQYLSGQLRERGLILFPDDQDPATGARRNSRQEAPTP